MELITDERQLPGLYMLWPGCRLSQPPLAAVPRGYSVRSYEAGDEPALRALLGTDGWAMSEDHWRDYRGRLLPWGLFLLTHEASGTLVATAGAVHNPSPGRFCFPFGGELGYLDVHPDHRGRGLGTAVAALVVRRLLVAGHDSIRVGVQGFRLPALKTYLKLGFVPFLHDEGLLPRWKRICEQLGWPFTPDDWPKTLAENAAKS
jgi:mycothiol synthase